jgi:hypothetical protein
MPMRQPGARDRRAWLKAGACYLNDRRSQALRL